MPTDVKPSRPSSGRVRSALVRLAGASLDNDEFRYEAAAVLRQAIGFDWWCWPLLDPGNRLPGRYVGVETPADSDYRRFFQLVIDPGALGVPDGWTCGQDGDAEADSDAAKRARRFPGVLALSAATRGDLGRDLLWREMLGPAGAGDVVNVMLPAGGQCWGQVHFGRDQQGRSFSEDDERLLAELAPLLGSRLRAGMRVPRRGGDEAAGDEQHRDADPDSGNEPGTIILDRDLSLVAATGEAWRWISRLAMPQLNKADPLPGFVYAVAAACAGSDPVAPARIRLQDADGQWVVARAAPLTPDPRVPGTGHGYAITLERARSEDLAPLLMRAWALSPREREVARLVIDGLSNEDIATTLFISANTVRDHVKSIFGKTGITRRRDLTAALAGPPA